MVLIWARVRVCCESEYMECSLCVYVEQSVWGCTVASVCVGVCQAVGLCISRNRWSKLGVQGLQCCCIVMLL